MPEPTHRKILQPFVWVGILGLLFIPVEKAKPVSCAPTFTVESGKYLVAVDTPAVDTSRIADTTVSITVPDTTPRIIFPPGIHVSVWLLCPTNYQPSLFKFTPIIIDLTTRETLERCAFTAALRLIDSTS